MDAIASVFLGKAGRAVRIGGYRFAPRIVPTLAMAAFVALTGWLSLWQGQRAAQREGRQALYEARMLEPPLELTGPAPADAILYRRVRASGRWIAEKQAFVDNQVIEGRGAGYAVVTPLRLEGSGAVVLVDRGWVARGTSYPTPPEVPVPAGPVQVTGLAAEPPARFVELSDQAIAGAVFQNLTLDRFRHWSGLDILSFEIVADPPGPGLVATSERPDAGAQRNREYQATWFLLAATAAALWIGLNLKKVP